MSRQPTLLLLVQARMALQVNYGPLPLTMVSGGRTRWAMMASNARGRLSMTVRILKRRLSIIGSD